MSSRTRMMGAGNASSTKYNSNVNLNTGGGSKKQGITSRVGLDNWANLAIQTYSNGYGRNKLFVMNQLGGVGAGRSMFNGRFTQVDGVKSAPRPSYYVNTIAPMIRRLAYLLSLYPPYVSTINPATGTPEPYRLALVGDKETFKQDLIDAGFSDLANEAHARILHFDSTYVFPDVPNRGEIIRLNNIINGLAKQQIPTTVNGIYFGVHTTAMMPVSTGTELNSAGYGITRWNGLRVYHDYNVHSGSSPTSGSDVIGGMFNGI
jgi:hypothetical protein